MKYSVALHYFSRYHFVSLNLTLPSDHKLPYYVSYYVICHLLCSHQTPLEQFSIIL
jgi:hypothetical protein